MQEIIYLLIAFVTFSHGQFSSEDYPSYRQELYNVKNGTYNQDNDLLPNIISHRRQYPHQRGRFRCIKSGIFADIYDCGKYYECIKVGNQRSYKFRQITHKCEHSKVYSYARRICTRPKESGRAECKNYGSWKKQDGSEIEEHQSQNGAEHNTWEESQDSQESDSQDVSLNIQELVKAKGICKREGYLPHTTDKTKYYRCLRLRSGQFVLYEFSCHSGTVWDQVKQMCSNPGNKIGDSNSQEGNRRNMWVETHLTLDFNSSINR